MSAPSQTTPGARVPPPLAAFLRQNAPWLAAGMAMTLASSFGQTFFIAVFAGEIRATFGLSHGAWGGIYTAGTLSSAALMIFMGGLTDRIAPRKLASVVLVVFAGVCLAMALVPAAILLVPIIFGLRFCGQGMMSHIAVVATGRWFQASRGRAISIVSTGFSMGEAVLPITFVLLIGAIGWRASWAVAAVLVLVFLLPLAVLLKADRQPAGLVAAAEQPGMGGRHWTRGAMLGHWLFWVCFPGLLAQPVFGTALFFHQVHLTELKGWPLESFVALLPLYTLAGLTGLFGAGAAIDRWGSGRVLPLIMLPMAAGFTTFALGPGLGHAALGFMLVGLMQGMGAATAGVFWPEYYGTRHLGAVRATAASLSVFATGIGPGLTGALIDTGVDLRLQFLGMAGYALAMAVILSLALARVRREAQFPVVGSEASR